MANKAYDEFKELEKEILAVPELKANAAVQKTLTEINDKFAKDTNYFKEVGEVFTSLKTAIPKFTSPKSNKADIMSGVFQVSSSLLKVIGLIPGASVVTGPLSTALKLIGNIFGVFGSSEGKYNTEIADLINNAVDQLETDMAVSGIKGKINEMKGEHELLASILSKTYADPSKLLVQYHDFTVKYFINIGEFELGVAYSDLLKNTDRSHRANWANAAAEFYSISQLVAFKVLYMVEGIAFFELAEEKEGLFVRTNQMKDSLLAFMTDYYQRGQTYFIKPTLTVAAITHSIYRLDQSEFDLLSELYDYLSSGKASYWPSNASNYRFNCAIPQKHNVGSTGSSECIRLTTLFAHREKEDKKNRVLSTLMNADTDSVSYNADRSTAAPVYTSKEHEEKSPETAHFAIWARLDGRPDKPPYYNWVIEAKNKHKEHYSDQTQHHNYHEKEFVFRDEGFYIFQVFPDDNELNNVWESDWHKKPEKNRTYIMIGSRGGDKTQVWTTYHHKNTGSTDYFKKVDYFDIVYNDKNGFGCPDHCMWYLLGQDEW